MSGDDARARNSLLASSIMIFLMFTVVLAPLTHHAALRSEGVQLQTGGQDPWTGYEQPWSQYARTPTHNQTIPSHGPDGGPGQGNVSDVDVLGTLEHPVVNWQVFETGDGSDAYGSILGDFSQSISASPAARERCGAGTLFPVMISSTIVDGSRESHLNIVSGNDAKIAWRASLGVTDAIRSTPMIYDIDDDGFQEIIVVYDTESAMHIDVWSPRLTCTESSWQVSGHTNELMWSYSDADVRIASPSPHWPTENSGHKAVTQPLLADLELDGTPELVLSVVDDPDNNPSIFVQSYSLTTAQPSNADWSVNLDRGTHPSDPVWAQLDSSTTSILLTTIDTNSGNMWIWQIDGATGSLDWERVAVPGTDSGNSDAPRLRLPGPVITQLDQDAAPEMVLTVPTDPNGRTSGTGARFIGMEITSATEVFNFRAPNGFADAQPTPVDTTEDGVADRLCWVTWYSDSAINPNERKGMLGCTDISGSTPVNEWVRDLERGSGTGNDEIGVSPPFWMDIDGEGTAEILVGFGRRLWAFDGDTGASADINNEWSVPLSMPHRVWTAPAIADVDGDGHIDVLYGDTLVSDRGADLAPSSDNRGLSFNPAQADPGDMVTVTAQFSNVGTAEADDDVDAVIIMNGVELKRERFTSSEPVAPSGEGGPMTFTAEFTAELGTHTFELVLDVNGNISEQREDNNHADILFTVVEPYVAELLGPTETSRVVPGQSQQIDLFLTSTGSRTADWTLSYNNDGLPDGWGFSPLVGQSLGLELIPEATQTISFEATVPASALGDESGVVALVLSLDSDQTINTTLNLPIEVFRTRGLDLTGPTGLNASDGQGRPGHTATAWFMVENLGNAEETTTSITWTAPSWGGSPSIHDANGNQLFSITLEPGEMKELFAHLPTPGSATYGSTTSTTLTICMGGESETLCESMPFTFTSQKFAFVPTHHRSLPASNLSWNLTGTVPSSGMVQWNMAAMGMMEQGWSWSAEGDWSINGTYIEAQGVMGDTVTGDINLDLPQNAVPKRHVFTGVDSQDSDAVFNATLHVLQIYRANLSLIEPVPSSEAPILSLNVTEPHRFLLFLSNPGNGVDTFTVSASISDAQSISTNDVAFTYYDPVKTLGALATGIGTVDVTLSEDVPALVPFNLTFSWTSEGSEGQILDQVTVPIQAAPSHEWEVLTPNGTAFFARPGESLNITVNVSNLGNAVDALVLDPVINVAQYGEDLSSWSAASVGTPNLAVNATTTLNFAVEVPAFSWAGSNATLRLDHRTSGYVIGQTTLTIEVLPVSGWRLNLTDADLEIDPHGENMTLQLTHTGNAYETAYFAKAGAGWNMTLPEYVGPIAPYGTTAFTVFVQPPSDALAGEIGVLQIRITGNDTSGMIEEEVPVRVGAEPQIHIDHRSSWSINENGGFPTAWIENQGNDIALLTIDVAGLPEGWTTQQGSQLVLAPGEVAGIPLELIPSAAWNQQRFLVTINVHHPVLGTLPHSIEVEYSLISFAQTPVRDAFAGTAQSIAFHNNATQTPTLSSTLGIEVDDDTIRFSQPSTTGEQLIDYSSGDEQGNISIYAVSRAYPASSIECSFTPSVFEELGRSPLSGTIASCALNAAPDEPLRAVVTATTTNGERIDLSEEQWTVPAGESETVNISLASWNPNPGLFSVQLNGFDQYGRMLEERSLPVTSREAGWNIGINSLSTDGDITVGIKRTGYSLLTDAVCELLIEASGGWKQTYIVDVAYAEFAPVISVDDPGQIEKDEKITATLSCSLPFDVDDDPTDDSMSTYYKPNSLLSVGTNDIGWIAGITLAILAVAWLSGYIRPQKSSPRSRNESPEVNAQTENEAEPEAPQPKPLSTEDDIQVEVEEDSDVAEVPEQTTDAEETPRIDTVEVIEAIEELPPEMPETASGRLASLRDEMGASDGVEREGTLEDRMKDFFRDE